MKNLLHFLLAVLVLTGIYSCNNTRTFNTAEPMLGMILMEDTNSIQIDKVVSELRTKWNLSVDDKEAGKEASVLSIDDYTIAIMNMPMPIPGDEIESAAGYNYFWQNGAKEATKHKGHVILSIMNAGKDPVKENILFNKVAAAILNNSNSIGFYMGGRTLLLKKDFYLANTELMTDKDFPLDNWIYFGLRQENGKQSMYTYGMFDFNKPEMEILDSDHSFEELDEMMFNMVHYVIASDITLKAGETIGMSATQKLQISYSKGKYLDGKTLKIKY